MKGRERPPAEPTGEECMARAQLADGWRACWYPQMGGYTGKAVARPDGHGCVEVWVWHDGDFPFSGGDTIRFDDGRTRNLHHCSPDQFIAFGEFLNGLLS